jgi:hypothetical protein
MSKIYLLLLCLVFTAPNALQAGQVLPKMGGAQVSAPMKHLSISLIGTTLNVQVDTSVPAPLLRPLQSPDTFDPEMAWSVLTDKAYNFQYGWNASGFWAPPVGSAIWIESLETTLGLEVYHVPGLLIAPTYTPIFGTVETPLRWQWDGSMTHNAYAVLDPTESEYLATYKVYIGDQQTGLETAGYTSAQVELSWLAQPVLTADFNQDQAVDAIDLATWQQNYGLFTGATRSQGDANADGSVDGQDWLRWQRQFTGPPATLSTHPVPEPGTLALALVALAGLAARPKRS